MISSPTPQNTGLSHQLVLLHQGLVNGLMLDDIWDGLGWEMGVGREMSVGLG